jgi:hypothetical protein
MRIWLADEHGARPAAPPTAEVVPAGPPAPEDLAAHYDLTTSLPDGAFCRYLAEAVSAHGLTFAALHEGIIHEALRRLADGRLTAGFHLDTVVRWRHPDDPCARLAQAVADAGGCPVNPPARLRLFTDRAAAHAELVRRGLGVPATAVVCPQLECADFVARPASWRVLYCLGELIPLWWAGPDGSGCSGRPVTREEIRCHRLRPALQYAAAVARISGLEWFATDLCLTEGPEPSRYRVPAGGGRGWAVVAAEAVHDPYDALVPGELPDAVVRHVAGRFAEAAWLYRHTAAVAPAPRTARRAA